MKNGSVSDDPLAPLQITAWIVAGPIAGTYQYNVNVVRVVTIGLKPLYKGIEAYNHYSLSIGGKSKYCFRFWLWKANFVRAV